MTLTSPRASNHQTPARDRLLAAGDELFYAEGIHAVGVDRIIEHAGVSRASFYDNFDRKNNSSIRT
jgi:AcrR family transcriptional regulator